LLLQGKERTIETKNFLQALPTYTHMSIVALFKHLKNCFLISQNCDGLHRKSGIAAHEIVEVHGNSMIEKCEKCKREYMRDFDVCLERCEDTTVHLTGRFCDDLSVRKKFFHFQLIKFLTVTYSTLIFLFFDYCKNTFSSR